MNIISKPQFLKDVEYKPSKSLQVGKEWSWLNPKHAKFDTTTVEGTSVDNPANYYESSLSDWHTFDSLKADLECDVVVIGGGLLGSSTALHLAEQGVNTVLLEKNRIGSAASGRNGGQLTPGLARWEAQEMADRLGYEDAKNFGILPLQKPCNLLMTSRKNTNSTLTENMVILLPPFTKDI